MDSRIKGYCKPIQYSNTMPVQGMRMSLSLRARVSVHVAAAAGGLRQRQIGTSVHMQRRWSTWRRRCRQRETEPLRVRLTVRADAHDDEKKAARKEERKKGGGPQEERGTTNQNRRRRRHGRSGTDGSSGTLMQAAEQIKRCSRALIETSRRLTDQRKYNGSINRKDTNYKNNNNNDYGSGRSSSSSSLLDLWKKQARELRMSLNMLLCESPTALASALTSSDTSTPSPSVIFSLLNSLIDVMFVLSGKPFTLDLSLYGTTSHINYLKKNINIGTKSWSGNTRASEYETENKRVTKAEDNDTNHSKTSGGGGVAVDVMRLIVHLSGAHESLEAHMEKQKDEVKHLNSNKSTLPKSQLPKLLKSMVMVTDNLMRIKNKQTSFVKKLESEQKEGGHLNESNYTSKRKLKTNATSTRPVSMGQIPNATKDIDDIVAQIMDMSRAILLHHVTDDSYSGKWRFQWMALSHSARCSDIGEIMWCYGKMRQTPGIDVIDATVLYLTQDIDALDIMDKTIDVSNDDDESDEHFEKLPHPAGSCLLDTMDSKSLSLVLWFFGRVFYLPADEALSLMMAASKKKMIEIGSELSSLPLSSSSLLSSLSLSLMLWSLATLGIRPDNDWLEHAANHAAHGVDWKGEVSKRRALDLINIIWALSSMRYVPDEPVLESIMRVTLMFVDNTAKSKSNVRPPQYKDNRTRDRMGDRKDIIVRSEERSTINVDSDQDREILFAMRGVVRLFMSLTKWSVASAEPSTKTNESKEDDPFEEEEQVAHNPSASTSEGTDETMEQYQILIEEEMKSPLFDTNISVRGGNHRLWVPPNSLLHALCRDVKILTYRPAIIICST